MAPVHEAAEDNDVVTLQGLLDLWPWMIDAEDEEDEDGPLPLHIACCYGSLGAARLLLDRGAAIDAKDREGATPLMLACSGGFVELVEMLLRRGADPTLCTAPAACTTLGFAVFGLEVEDPVNSACDYPTVLRRLIEDGRVPINARVYGATALWWACSDGHADQARVLLVEGRADHTLTATEGRTALDEARHKGQHECVALLEWFEGELERAHQLIKARAVVDATEGAKAIEQRVKGKAEVAKAKEQAAPVYLRGRVVRGEALPEVELVRKKMGGGMRPQKQKARKVEVERRAVLEHVVRVLNTDLFLDLMGGLRYHNR